MLVRHTDAETREEIDETLLPDDVTVIDDPDLPASLQGVKAPSWWAKGRPSPTARKSRRADGKQTTYTFAE